MTIGKLREQIRNLDDSFEIIIENYEEGEFLKLQNGVMIDSQERVIILGTEMI